MMKSVFRESVKSNWLLKDFQIAHTQAIHHKGKYLIPLMRGHVTPQEIQCPDLKLYIETHTYLKCNDLVRYLSLPRVGVALSQCYFQSGSRV